MDSLPLPILPSLYGIVEKTRNCSQTCLKTRDFKKTPFCARISAHYQIHEVKDEIFDSRRIPHKSEDDSEFFGQRIYDYCLKRACARPAQT